MARRLLLASLALASALLAGFVLVEAALTDHLTGQIFFAVLPLLMLFAISWKGLRRNSD